jgi:hypothetical protein
MVPEDGIPTEFPSYRAVEAADDIPTEFPWDGHPWDDLFDAPASYSPNPKDLPGMRRMSPSDESMWWDGFPPAAMLERLLGPRAAGLLNAPCDPSAFREIMAATRFALAQRRCVRMIRPGLRGWSAAIVKAADGRVRSLWRLLAACVTAKLGQLLDILLIAVCNDPFPRPEWVASAHLFRGPPVMTSSVVYRAS